MTNTWKLTIWGVRGSIPTPAPAFLEYGGNTPCISLECADALVALDAGSGLTGLGAYMARRDLRRADILLGHLHLDHVIGLFAFPLRYDPAAELHLYGRPGLTEKLARLIGPPLWPVDLMKGGGQIQIHEINTDRPFHLANGAAPDITITALEGNHPGGCCYYRLTDSDRSLVYVLDCELSEGFDRELTAFARGADLLIWDAGFAPGKKIKGWGHSTWNEGLSLGRTAGVKQVLMSHYGPDHTDVFLREQERLADLASPLSRFAKEGMVIEL